MSAFTKVILVAVSIGLMAAALPPIVSKISADSHTHSRNQPGRGSQQGSSSATPAEIADVNAAWDFLASTVHPAGTGVEVPQWTTWSDKCEVGLKNPSNGCPDASSSPQTDPNTGKADFFSMRVPVQVNVAAKEDLNGKTKVDSPQLASVLFNPAAADYLESFGGLGNFRNLDSILSGLNPADSEWRSRELPPPNPDGPKGHPVVVKLIWEVVYDENPLVSVYDNAPELQNEYIDPTAPTRLLSASSWPRYRLNPNQKTCNPTSPPEPISSGNPPPSISLSCFYNYPIDLSDPKTRIVLAADQQQALGGPFLVQKPAHALLVGFHAMVLTKDHPLWDWMTFYWTRQTNGHTDWSAPWQHLQVKTTTTDGDVESSIHISGPVFNPYLEGQVGNNGMNTNCLSCHSLAAYTPTPSNGTPNNTVANVTRSQLYARSADPKAASFPAAEYAAVDHHYFHNALRTSFLWSLDTNQFPLTQNPPTTQLTKPK